MDFVDWVDGEREQRGWSKAQLARSMNVSQPYVSRVLSRQQNPGDDFLQGIALAFGVTIETVYRHVGKLPPEPVEDTWVRDMQAKLLEVPEELRDIAESLIKSLAERERKIMRNRK